MSKTLQARAAGASPTTADLVNKPGTFMEIPVAVLKVDTEYQRGLTSARLDRMASDWSWIACGVVTVALRGAGSGEYYVIDGQHRVRAAERAGITELPCLVFESQTHIDEAQGFLDANTSRRAMSVVDRYRALLVVEDPNALRVAEFLRRANREASMMTAGAYAATRVSCIDTIMGAVIADNDKLERIWPILVELCEGRLITKRIIQGLFYLERFLTNTSLTERHWRRRIMQVGYDAIHRSIDETSAYEGKRGAAVSARGVLRALNHGLRNKLRIEVGGSSDLEAAE